MAEILKAGALALNLPLEGQRAPHGEPPPAGLRPPLVAGNPSLHDITEEVARPLDARPTLGWFACLGVAGLALLAGAVAVTYEIATGIGTWGLNRTVGWAFDITNFVFWVGIGHAGTLISAILLLFRQKWRTSIARSAEAMTIFAVMCAGLFPLIHMGRPWFSFWVFPYPNSRGPLWVNFRSPLLWDVFAISTYFTISLVFWYVGMIPDLATPRDRATGRIKRFLYGLFALGWDGSHRTWSRYETLSLLLAGLAAPLVISVHSIVSMDFATSVIPGWHTTLFPPYFVAGAVFSGFGMVMTLLIITRKVMNLKRYITMLHLEAMAKVILLTGTIVGFCYLTEFFVAWYSGNLFERYRLRQPRDRPLRLGLLDDDELQPFRAPAPLVEAAAHQPAGAFRPFAPRQRRYVVRALRHHRHLAPPRLSPLQLVRCTGRRSSRWGRSSAASASSSPSFSSSSASCR